MHHDAGSVLTDLLCPLTAQTSPFFGRFPHAAFCFAPILIRTKIPWHDDSSSLCATVSTRNKHTSRCPKHMHAHTNWLNVLLSQMLSSLYMSSPFSDFLPVVICLPLTHFNACTHMCMENVCSIRKECHIFVDVCLWTLRDITMHGTFKEQMCLIQISFLRWDEWCDLWNETETNYWFYCCHPKPSIKGWQCVLAGTFL